MNGRELNLRLQIKTKYEHLVKLVPSKTLFISVGREQKDKST